MYNYLPANPLPNSNPLVAGRDSAAFAKSASSLSKTGEPSPYRITWFQVYNSSVRTFTKQK